MHSEGYFSRSVCVRVSVCLSVRPSGCPQYFLKTMADLNFKHGYVMREDAKILERRSPGKLVKQVGVRGSSASLAGVTPQ